METSTDYDELGTRLHQFKNKGRNATEQTRRRKEFHVKLRKAKKDDQILERRHVQTLQEEPTSSPQPQQYPLQEILAGVNSENREDQFLATQAVRKLLSRDNQPPIDRIISAGLIQKFVSFLGLFECPPIQFEAAWVLTNIASGNPAQTNAVVVGGGIPGFIRLASSSYLKIREQAIWALGSIAGDGPDCRDLVIKHGGHDFVVALVESPDLSTFPLAFIRNITWTLSNLCRHTDRPPPLEAVKRMLPALVRLLHHNDKEVLSGACWAVSYLTSGSNERIEVVVQTGLVPRLVQLLSCGEHSILAPALRSLGNIVTGTNEQTQCVLNAGALAVFPALLCHRKSNIQKEAAWAVSNITSGKATQIQEVIDAGLIPLLVQILQQADYKTQLEAVWAVINLTKVGTLNQVSYLYRCNVLGPLFNLLTVKDDTIILIILEAISNILQMAESVGEGEKVCLMIEKLGDLEKIEALQFHSNESVYKYSNTIIDRFFSGQNEDEFGIPEANPDHCVFHAPDNQSTFQF
uniref:Importin subunit alpha n=1 Tax=Nothobranchius kadleci TaxID=1051664 RepID=A0A1A8C3Z5_NOTKA